MAENPRSPSVDTGPVHTGFAMLEAATQRAIGISQGNVGKTHTGRQRRALMVFSKMIVHNLAMTMIIGKFFESENDNLLDHFSLAVIARSSIDAALMTMYISEPSLSLKQWDFRRHLLFLHDANNRSRFLKPLRKHGVEFGFFENADEIREQLRAKIQELGSELFYSSAKIGDYKQGLHLYVDGTRGAVREAG